VLTALILTYSILFNVLNCFSINPQIKQKSFTFDQTNSELTLLVSTLLCLNSAPSGHICTKCLMLSLLDHLWELKTLLYCYSNLTLGLFKISHEICPDGPDGNFLTLELLISQTSTLHASPV
jgi:hypothetical protein